MTATSMRRVKKQQVWIGKTMTLHVLSLYNYNVKIPNFTFCGGYEHMTTTSFFLFPELQYSPLELNTANI